MHPYATDSVERIRVTAILVALSLVIGRLLDRIASRLPDWTGFVFDLSAAGLFIVLFWLTDNYLWRWRIFHWPWLFQVPNLSGCWRGQLYSSYSGMKDPLDCDLEIKQSWTRMTVKFQTHHKNGRSSKSASRAASLLLDQDGDTVLRYEYHNEPDESMKGILDIHWGTTKVVVCEQLGNLVLEGSYYTNRVPQTYGKFTLRRG